MLAQRLSAAYGAQHWWPGDSAFEVMVGAVLTQNTAWRNVEQAMAGLRSARLLSPERMASRGIEELARLIRPAGYYNVKAGRLANLCRFIRQQGGMSALAAMQSEKLRCSLLAVNGVGPETTDSILLYAFDRPVFVIDAYTRRICRRLGMIDGDEAYETLRMMFEQGLDADSRQYNELHALLVRHAKSHCRSKPACAGCCLSSGCREAQISRAGLSDDAAAMPEVSGP